MKKTLNTVFLLFIFANLSGFEKIATILLLALFLFNWFGYRALISFMENKANARLETQLDENNYDESQLLSIKVPARHLSSYTNSKLFERVDGQVEINGVQYNFVKRRLFNDSLELLCIPNHDVMQLSSAKNDFFKIVNDLQRKENKKSTSGFSKNILSDYVQNSHEFLLNYLYFTNSSWLHHSHDAIPSYYSSVLENPPKIFFSFLRRAVIKEWKIAD